MRKTLLFVFICFYLVACRKIENNISVDSKFTIQSDIKQYLLSVQEKATKNKIKIADLIERIDFNSIRQYANTRYENTSMHGDMILLDASTVDLEDYPIKKLSESIKSNAQNNNSFVVENKVVKAVFFRNDEGKIYDVLLVKINSSGNTKEFIENHFNKIMFNEEPEFSGTLVINSIVKKFINKITIKNGKLSSFSKVAFDKPQKNANIKSSACLAWYLEITYYFSDGTSTTTSQFLGTTGCGGSGDISNEGLEPPGDGSELPPDSICAQNQRYANDIEFKSAIKVLGDSINAEFENGFYISTNSSGSRSYTSIRGDASGVKQPKFKTDGVFHHHTTSIQNMAKTFSLHDIGGLYWNYDNGYINNLSTYTFGLVLPNGKTQILRITDPIKFIQFGRSNWNPVSLGYWIDQNKNNFSNTQSYADALKAMVRVLSDSGLTLYEADTLNIDAGFEEVSIDPANTQSIKRKKCSN